MRNFPLQGPLGATLRETPPAPAPVRDAATVMLVRDGARGVEVFVFRRVRGMAFAAGMVVFPGGAVDPSDADPRLSWASGPPADVEPEVAVAAVRETFEECGVLLAVPSAPDDPRSADPRSADPRSPDSHWAADPQWAAARREDVVAGRAALVDVLLEGGLVLDADLLHLWAHWLTPESEPRRYDTRFFVARVPDGQEPLDLGGEGEHARWILAADALAQGAAGELGIMPPTQVCLEELAAAGSVEALFATRRTVRRVCPWVAQEEGPDGTPRLVLRVHLDGLGGGEPRGSVEGRAGHDRTDGSRT